MVNPKKKPEFLRHVYRSKKRLRNVKWRRPRGIHNKILHYEKGHRKMPNVGYGAPRELRYLHPSGFREVLVHSFKDLEKIDLKKEAVKIAHDVGMKKRKEMLKKAEEMKMKVLNP